MAFEVWLSEDAARDRARLSTGQERKLIWWRDRLARDATAGDPIRKSLIPAALRRKYKVDNFWRLELPDGWRALYTVASLPAGRPQIMVLRILSHKGYDRLFGYSTS